MSSSASTGILVSIRLRVLFQMLTNSHQADHDLVRPVHQLAEDVEEAMRALYQLHTALVNHFSTSPLIEDFRVRRDQFRAECEAIVALLRRCQDECNAFTFVLGNMRIAPKMQINAFIGRMVSRAQRISGEAHKLAATHHAACEDLRLKLDETRAIFPRLSPRQESSDSLHLYGTCADFDCRPPILKCYYQADTTSTYQASLKRPVPLLTPMAEQRRKNRTPLSTE